MRTRLFEEELREKEKILHEKIFCAIYKRRFSKQVFYFLLYFILFITDWMLIMKNLNLQWTFILIIKASLYNICMFNDYYKCYLISHILSIVFSRVLI